MLDYREIINSIGATEANYTFRPVKCTENDIDTKPVVEGFVYFTSDSKRIYLGTNNGYLPMGGNSGIYYGQHNTTDEEFNVDQITFQIGEIEGKNKPNTDDLIFNIPDSCFYRVGIVNAYDLVATRLAVAGGGGGVGPGGGGGGNVRPVITLNKTGTQYFVVSDKDNMKIGFKATSLNLENNYVSQIEYMYGTQIIYTDTSRHEFNENITFDVSEYLNKFSTISTNTLGIRVTDAYGITSNGFTYTYFDLIDLKLQSKFDSIYRVKSDSPIIRYYFVPQGGNNLQNKQVVITLAPIDNVNDIRYTGTVEVKQLNDENNVNIDLSTLEEGKITHGVYLLSATYVGQTLDKTAVSSNPIYSQIIYYDKEVNTPLIATDLSGDISIMQYSRFIMNYMIVDDNTKLLEDEVKIYVGDTPSTQKVPLNQINQWVYTFAQNGIYDISIEYSNSGKKSIGRIIVELYKGELPIIDKTAVEFYLTAMGKDNAQSDRDVWEWNGHRANFTNFLWGKENGWVSNEKGETALKLSNGAKLTIPTYFPFETNATNDGLTIELDFMVSGVLDYAAPLIECLSISPEDGKPNVGFRITGQKATLNSNKHKATTDVFSGEADDNGNINSTQMALQAFTQYFNEDTRIHLAYVIERIPNSGTGMYFAYTYLNGVLSGIMRMESDERFIDYSANTRATFTFDSQYGEIYLYNIRTYRNAISARTIINNYVADLTDPDEKLELYKKNNIFDENGFISYKAISDLSYTLQVPYVVLEGGCPMVKKKTDEFSFTNEFRLPYSKSDYRLMSMRMYQANSATGVTEEVMNVPMQVAEVANENTVVNDFTKLKENTSYKPKRGVQVYGQGTSSMVYPVKNLRLKFIQEEDYPTVYEGSCPIEIVCFKADYMDSSSSHNTPTGNLVYDLYAKMGMRTPPQQFKVDNQGKDGVVDYDLVTAIRGYPIICFYHDPISDTYTYIGRYNFNLDKATPEPFGFTPQWFYTGKETSTGRKEVKAVGLLTETVEGMTVLPLDEEGKEIERDIIQCWEMLNNDANSPTKFLTPNRKDSDVKYESYETALKEDNNWINYYEDRYPDELVGVAENINKGEADAREDWPTFDEDMANGIYRLSTWINSTATIEANNSPLAAPVYYFSRDKKYNNSKKYYTDTNGTEAVITPIDTVNIINTGIKKDENGVVIQDGIIPVINDKDKFIGKVSEYGTYLISHRDGLWYLDDEEEPILSLEEYGISYSGSPSNSDILSIDYFVVYEGWESNRYYELYTNDTAEYRLAKFRNEFNQYLNKDFCSFYYVLTMMLLMMDSRAKNMMLASWDQTIWYPIFYDMDTMLGVNNTGFNKFSFDTEDDPKDKVFNGYDSVLWNNYRECFYDDICAFYSDMRSKGLTLDNLLKIYNDNSADSWNEALTTADAIYKYKRPLQEGYKDGSGEEVQDVEPGKVSYLYAGQGKRSNHRAWWLYNRFGYFDSKYLPTQYGSVKPGRNTFAFRAYALPEQESNDRALACIEAVKPNHTFDLTALNNSYQSIMIGNIVYGPVYTKVGDTVNLGSSTPKHEVESWILNPTLIADLGDLSDKYIGSFIFPNGITRLTSLRFGRSVRSHADNYQSYYNNNLSELSIGNSCPYLDYLNIANCTGLASVNLTQCPRLRVIDAVGCNALSSLTLPTDSILSELYLPSNSLKELTIINQPYLNVLELENASTLNKIHFDKISNFNTYPIVRQALEVCKNNSEIFKSFYLTDINWTIEDNSLVDGEIENIDILDIINLSNVVSEEGYTKEQSINGTITIDMNCKVDEYTIYEKYRKLFPNIKIQYSSKVNKTDAVKIEFKIDENSTHYEVYSNGDKEIGWLISAAGPTGMAMTKPTRGSSLEYSYEFTGHWICDGVRYYEADAAEPTGIALNTFKPTSDMVFMAEFKAIDRYYEVKFYNGTEVILQDGKESWPVRYGRTYDGPIINFCYRDDSGLPLTQRYTFKGWTNTNYGDSIAINPDYVEPTELEVKGNVNLYAYFEAEDVYKSATDNRYFNFNAYSSNVYGDGYSISLKPEYTDAVNGLKGKITLPSIYNGKPIVELGNFSKAQFSHMFFMSDAQYKVVNICPVTNNESGVDYYCFKSKIKNIELPKTIQVISSNAFRHMVSLETLNIADLEKLTIIGSNAFAHGGAANSDLSSTQMQVQISTLPDSVVRIESAAFQINKNNVTINKLPASLNYVGSYAFNHCYNMDVKEFGRNDENAPNLVLENEAFSESGDNANISEITLGKSLSSVGTNCFKNYNDNKFKKIVSYNSNFATLNSLSDIISTTNKEFEYLEV